MAHFGLTHIYTSRACYHTSWVILLLMSFSMLHAKERTTSYPYLSGDTWRFFCDWELSIYRSFNPASIQTGDTVFVEQDALQTFNEHYLPLIKNRFILITPNSERGSDDPLPAQHRSILDSPMVYRWLVQNIDCEPTEKLIPIPIGLANTVWEHGDLNLINYYIPYGLKIAPTSRCFLAYLNFNTNTNVSTRHQCRKYFETCPFCQIEPPKYYGDYLYDLAHSIFVVSPPGNGLDCHRTWEALLMGCYPIVKSSTLNPLYKDLPVVIIDEWETVTEEFLLQKLDELMDLDWSRDKLYAPYWFDIVRKYQDELKEIQ